MTELIARINKNLTSPVAVLMGGVSAERAISLNSGEAVLHALQDSGIRAVALDPQQNEWLSLLDREFDHCFINLHGIHGEDGTVQGALELLGISYTGSGVMASAIAMNKLLSKQLWRGVGVPTADFMLAHDDLDYAELLNSWQQLMVKPVTEGSSIGMSKVTTEAACKAAVEHAYHYSSQVMLERWISGEEYTVAILDDKVLPAIKLEAANDFYDFNAKYQSRDTQYLCPCGLTSEDQQALQMIALQAYQSLGCSGWGRVDVMRNEQGEFLVLEVNTSPGMTKKSLVPMAAKAAGIEFNELVLTILAGSLEAS